MLLLRNDNGGIDSHGNFSTIKQKKTFGKLKIYPRYLPENDVHVIGRGMRGWGKK